MATVSYEENWFSLDDLTLFGLTTVNHGKFYYDSFQIVFSHLYYSYLFSVSHFHFHFPQTVPSKSFYNTI